MSSIMFVSYSTGGAATYQAQQIDYLVSSGHQVTLIDENPAPTLRKIQRPISKSLRVIGAPVWSHPIAVCHGIQAILREQKQSIVSFQNPALLVKYAELIAKAALDKHPSVVITIHSGMLTMTLRRLLVEGVAAIVCPHLDDVVYVSQFTRSYWERRYPWMHRCKARVVHNGVDLPGNVTVRLCSNRLRIGFVGRLHREKDPILFCQIARLARQQGLVAEFHIFGEGPLEERISREYSEDVVLHGWQSEKDIYTSIDLLLITSPVENCPYALLEAKSYGIPVISAGVGGIPEIVEHGTDGIIVIDRSPSSFIDAIYEIRDRYWWYSSGCLNRRTFYCAAEKAEQTWLKRGLDKGTDN